MIEQMTYVNLAILLVLIAQLVKLAHHVYSIYPHLIAYVRGHLLLHLIFVLHANWHSLVISISVMILLRL